MLVGHFAVALTGKKIQPTLSLGTLMLAAMLADFLWTMFWRAGLEDVQFQDGVGAAQYIRSAQFALSHSLAALVVWAALFGATYFVIRREARPAAILFFIVLSHWLLDLVSLYVPVAPGVRATVGLRLWSSVPATLLIEGGAWVAAVVVYARRFPARTFAGTLMFWIGVAVWTLAWYNNIAGPPPRNQGGAPISSFIFFSVVVVWAYWMNALRPVAR